MYPELYCGWSRHYIDLSDSNQSVHSFLTCTVILKAGINECTNSPSDISYLFKFAFYCLIYILLISCVVQFHLDQIPVVESNSRIVADLQCFLMPTEFLYVTLMLAL